MLSLKAYTYMSENLFKCHYYNVLNHLKVPGLFHTLCYLSSITICLMLSTCRTNYFQEEQEYIQTFKGKWQNDLYTCMV